MTILPTSPTPNPSTKTRPALTRPPFCPERLVNSNICPLSPSRIWSFSTPISTANSPCFLSILYSPWTGRKYFGLIRPSIILSSSWLPCPDTWIRLLLPKTTLAPKRIRLSIVRPTPVSFPGIGVAEIITVSPGIILTLRWLFDAILDKPAIGSPWLPVVKISTWSAVYRFSSSASMRTPSGRRCATPSWCLGLRDRHIIYHTTPQDKDLALIQNSRIDSLLNAGNIGCKGCQYNSAFSILKLFAEGFSYRSFRLRIARSQCIRTVRHEK